MNNIPTQLEAFKSAMVSLYTEAYAQFPIPEYFKPESGIEIRIGKKNAKVLVTTGCQTSVYCFIDLANGDILKAAGQVPAKGKRGSIFNENCDVGEDRPCNVHGGNLYRK